MPTPWSATAISIHAVVATRLDRRPMSRRRCTSRRCRPGCRGRDQLPVAAHARAGRRAPRRRATSMRVLLGSGTALARRRRRPPGRPTTSIRARQRRRARSATAPAGRRWSAPARWASSTILSASRLTTAGSSLVGQRLGEHGERADRRLQLVADVGDEVGAHRVEPSALADVVDRRPAPRRPRAASACTASTRRGGPKNSTCLVAGHCRRSARRRWRSTASSTSTRVRARGTSSGRPFAHQRLRHCGRRARRRSAARRGRVRRRRRLGLRPQSTLAGAASVTLRLGYDGGLTPTNGHHGVPTSVLSGRQPPGSPHRCRRRGRPEALGAPGARASSR